MVWCGVAGVLHSVEHALQGAGVGARVRAQPAGGVEVPAADARGRAVGARGARAAPGAVARRHHRAVRRRRRDATVAAYILTANTTSLYNSQSSVALVA